MTMTKKEYDERVARLADGTSEDPDDDRRLVKLYENTHSTSAAPEKITVEDGAQAVDEPVEESTHLPRGSRVQRKGAR